MKTVIMIAVSLLITSTFNFYDKNLPTSLDISMAIGVSIAILLEVIDYSLDYKALFGEQE